ncbi:MAG: LPS export ABC transporter permease LptG [Gammaproteobacteria bacterium]|nr:LPS export ABC transporter permease LptG [Gammaproteobacteria bacterium]MCW8987807.1 LPS export ABC transporter permease LptG [Gammaproteobacteria bacterium]MCW9032199.1 LPS export ABC transporter permease LptG [Gammaproteobacteria bacterium]
MNLLDRYIGQSVITGVATVLTIFIILYELFAFAGEASKIGHADYTFWSALQYSLLCIPQHIYELFPLSMLLGTMLGLGWLANHNELVIIRLAGVSLLGIIGSIMKTAIMLMLIAMVIGEGIAPPLQQYATEQRIKLLKSQVNLNTDYGLWARDGNTYVNVDRVDNIGQLIGITLYQFTKDNFIERQIHARHAVYDGEQWILKSVKETTHKNNLFIVNHKTEMKWKTLLDLDTVKIVAVRPELLSIWKLNGYIDYLKNNDLEYTKYELVYWTKLFGPLTILAMVLLSIPFVFGSVRHISIGKQVLLGFLVGITFYIVSRLTGQMGLVYGIPAILSALLPNLLVIALTTWSYRKIR